MSTKDFTANVISATKVVPDGNFKNSKASGIWDINEALDLIKGGNWPNVANIDPSTIVDGLFSIDLWDGSGSARSITNDIDLSTKEGLVWIKKRSGSAQHGLVDTARGVTQLIGSSTDGSSAANAQTVTAFNSNGFSIGTDDIMNASGSDYVGWTFRSQPKFFDIVKYEGTGSARTVAHSLNSTVGMILIKNLDAGDNWAVYHRGNTAAPQTDYLILNSTAATADDAAWWNDTAPTSSVFTVGTDHSVNASGENYIAYLFAHNDDDGGFGEPGDQDIIKCGSYDGSGSNQIIDLGFEAQWVLTKPLVNANNWTIFDNMRGLPTTGLDGSERIKANDSSAGSALGPAAGISVHESGFVAKGGSDDYNQGGNTNIYVAIRRGGMQTPTDATTVYNTVLGEATNADTFTPGFPADMAIVKKHSASGDWEIGARVLHSTKLITNDTTVESTSATYPFVWDKQNDLGSSDQITNAKVAFCFKRARGFYDTVAYTGTGSARTVTHNLGIAPELMLIKNRGETDNWAVYYGDNTDYMHLNTSDVTADSDGYWNDTSPTSSVFTVGVVHRTNHTNETYIAHLFGTVAGVSKIGTYTGLASGSDVNVDCGFSAGARFILIKRSDTGATSGWHVFNTLRGIVSGNEKYMEINTSAAEQTNADLIDPLSSGFTVVGNDADISVEDATYVFLAIA